MERKDYLNQFEELILLPETDAWIQEMFQDFCENKKYLQDRIKETLQEFMTNIAKMQRIQPIAVGQIAISILRTSIWNGEPKLRLDAYDVNKEAGINLAYQYFDFQWFAKSFEQYKNRLIDGVEKNNLSRYIRIAQIEQAMSQQLIRAFSILILQCKYFFMDFDKIEGFEQMDVEDVFLVTAGEYLDHQKILFAKVPEIDLVAKPEERGTFQRIQNKIYRDKEWKDVDWRNARFEHCEFSKCQFTHVDMRDVRFTDCLFRMDELADCILYGARFENCTFRNMNLRKAKLEWHPFEEKTKEDTFYRELQFGNCTLDDEILEIKGDALWSTL